MKRIRFGVGSKIILAIESAILLVMVFSLVLAYFVLTDVFKQRTYVLTQSVSQLKQKNIDSLLNDITTEIEFFSHREKIRDNFPRYLSNNSSESREIIDNAAKELLQYKKVFSQISMLNEVGEVIYSSNPLEEGKIKSEDQYFTKAISTGRTFIQSYFFNISSRKIEMIVSTPLRDLKDKMVGVLVVEIEVKEINRTIGGRAGLGVTGETFLINAFNVVTTDLQKLPNAAMNKTIFLPQIESCLQGKSANFSLPDYHGDRVFGYYHWLPELNSCMVTKIDTSEALASVGKVLLTVVMIFIVGGLIMGFIGYLLARTITVPLNKLHLATVAIKEGKFRDENYEYSNDEIGDVFRSFSQMSGELKTLYQNLEDKVREKTTDLTSALSKLEDQNLTLEDSKTAILNVMDDLNEEKEKIASEKNRIETILKSIGDGVFVTDEQGKVVMINRAAEVITGLADTEILNKDYRESFKFLIENEPSAKYPDFVKEVIKEGKTSSLMPYSLLVSKDGNKIPVLDSAAPIITAEGKVIGSVVVVRDNTKERELEKSKDEFLSVASHQLRTPLGGMRWNLELLMDGEYGKLPEELEKSISELHGVTLMMISLVNDLLNVSRIDQGRVMDEPVDTDLGELIQQKVKDLQPLADQEKVDLQVSVEKGLQKVKIDPKRFGETVTNLVSNSIKYHREKGWVKVSFKLNKENNFELNISDNGIGIPKEAQKKLFEKFFRADNALKKQTEGSGLGLYIAKKFIDNWGGNISVESEVGVGTTVKVILPKNIKQPTQIEKNGKLK